jgi:DNA-binding transcriptional ArsR family regulator
VADTQTASDRIPPDTRVLGVGALRALAHPLRIRIYDLLAAHGPQTASSLADLVGESSGVTSYHLRALAKHDLIREVEGLGTARERWWERPRGAVSLSDPETARTPSGRAATEMVLAEFYRQRHDELMTYIAISMKQDPDEWPGTLLTANARLTRAQADELGRKIQVLVNDTLEAHRGQTGDGLLPYAVRADVFPLIVGEVGT